MRWNHRHPAANRHRPKPKSVRLRVVCAISGCCHHTLPSSDRLSGQYITPMRNQLASQQKWCSLLQPREICCHTPRWLHFYLFTRISLHESCKLSRWCNSCSRSVWRFFNDRSPKQARSTINIRKFSLLVNKTQTDPRRLSWLDIYFVVSINASSF